MKSPLTFAVVLASLVQFGKCNRYLFAFGDSYTWQSQDFNTQNTAPLVEQWGFARQYPGATSSNNGVPSPYNSYPGWAGHLFHDLSDNSTYAFNFAAVGATVDNSIVKGSNVPLTTQVQWFMNDFGPTPNQALWRLSTANTYVASFWFGVNDVGNLFGAGPGGADGNTPANQSAVVKSYMSQMQLLYNTGVMNFIVMGCPPFNRSQGWGGLQPSKAAVLGPDIISFNNILSGAVASQTFCQLPSCKMIYLDTSATFNNILNNYAAYGAPDPYCDQQGEGATCLWNDLLHPGNVIQFAVGQLIHDTLASQYNFYTTFSTSTPTSTPTPSSTRSTSSTLATSTVRSSSSSSSTTLATSTIRSSSSSTTPPSTTSPSQSCSTPKPPGWRCGVYGTLSNPKIAATVPSATTLNQCRDACIASSQCQVFGYNTTSTSSTAVSGCTLYTDVLPNLGYTQTSSGPSVYWNRHCFCCTIDAQQDGCSAPPTTTTTTTAAAHRRAVSALPAAVAQIAPAYVEKLPLLDLAAFKSFFKANATT